MHSFLKLRCNPWGATRANTHCPQGSMLVSPHVRESRTFLDSGFHAVDSGFRVLDSGFQYSGFRIPKRAGFQFFTFLILFFAFRFRVRILLYWKTLLECITSLFSFSIYQNYGLNVLQFCKGLWYNKEGALGNCTHRNTAETENNKHRITAKKRGETPTSQF